MKPISILFFVAVAIFFLPPGCTSTSTSKLIHIEDYTFARDDSSGNLVPVDQPCTFQKGEKVHLVLLHAGPFKKDSAGLNWFDMDIRIADPDGTEVISEQAMLGDKGHIALPDNYAESPYASIQTNESMKSGKYKFSITIYDKLGKGTATISAFFNLE